MRQGTRLCATALFVMTGVLAGAAESQPSVYVQPGEIDWQSLLSDPPAADSPQHRAELAEVLQRQARRTAEQVYRCRSEVELQPSLFDDVLIEDIDSRHTPALAALLNQARIDSDNVCRTAKKNWKRPRPYQESLAVNPCVRMEKNTSYPSGHAAAARVWGRILAELVPDKRDAVLARANLAGEDRVIAGVHFRSDVVAGQMLGDAVADKMLASPDFQAALDQAKSERRNSQ